MSIENFVSVGKDAIARVAQYLPGVLKIRFDRSPLATVSQLNEFVRTRSSYVAQTAMFGYLKARMGTQFPRFFEDEVFSRSIRIASARLFVTCLGDMTLFSVAHVRARGRLADDEAAGLAETCFAEGIDAMFAAEDNELVPAGALGDFTTRCRGTDWAAATDPMRSFAGSERDIVRFAPVIDEFKDADREIVGNSIRFRWRDVREQFRRRIDSAGVTEDWRTGYAGEVHK